MFDTATPRLLHGSLRIFILVLVAVCLAGCKIEVIIPPEGGWVTYELYEGDALIESDRCDESCIFDLAYPTQHIRFYPRPFGGFSQETPDTVWAFDGWKRAKFFLCEAEAGAFDYCGLDIRAFSGFDRLAEFLDSDITVKVEPVFVRVPYDEGTVDDAAAIEIGGEYVDQMQGAFDRAYYRFTLPYRGTLSLYAESLPAQGGPVESINLLRAGNQEPIAAEDNRCRFFGPDGVETANGATRICGVWLDRRLAAGEYLIDVGSTWEPYGEYYRLNTFFEGVPDDYELSTLNPSVATPINALLLASTKAISQTALTAANNDIDERIRFDVSLGDKDRYTLETAWFEAGNDSLSLQLDKRAEPVSLDFGDGATIHVLAYGEGSALVELGTHAFELAIPRSDQLLALGLWEDATNVTLTLEQGYLTTNAEAAVRITRYGSVMTAMLACAVANSPEPGGPFIDFDTGARIAQSAEKACNSPVLARLASRLPAADLDYRRVADISQDICATRDETPGQCLESALLAWEGESADAQRVKIVFPTRNERVQSPGDILQLFVAVREDESVLQRLRWYGNGVQAPVVNERELLWEVSSQMPVTIRAEAEYGDGSFASDSIVIEAP